MKKAAFTFPCAADFWQVKYRGYMKLNGIQQLAKLDTEGKPPLARDETVPITQESNISIFIFGHPLLITPLLHFSHLCDIVLLSRLHVSTRI
jgi:hypothetical protein